MSVHLIALTLAVIIDRLIGDPRWLPHPVIFMGKLISSLEKRWNHGTYRHFKGSVMVTVVIVVVLVVAIAVTWSAYQLHLFAGIFVEAFLISTTIAQQGLKQAAEEVATPLKQNQLSEARVKLSYIVGRDTDSLGEGEIVRGTVETVAENTSDGITAPLFFALIGGAPLALLYRAVNTCDSMVGYKNERYDEFGKSSARLDDLLNYIPSRITGLLMLISNKASVHQSKKRCFQILFRDAKRHPSPNSGWGEAATAALLAIQLGGRNTYQGIISNRAEMGDDIVRLERKHINEAVIIMNRTVLSFVIFLWILGGVYFVFT
ncbi:adenosylcobinamide-phosphate synthase CbiB [Desertibacillus haloalkaliphilus]|uniref:adenosylcobinamide-phosphate synthase CbiB n=1 Tax=Desertibacillus haloalkaliphilus TaxID=1328930 RepID=UPI001C25846D|nr:adenosylcobinamide-phosphate synthase CbiB [Desertibacillus haloalkaliphilus]MBU8907183.1 adenosylcobinamide-phosphate synthase CbiB [Desertibacillus haloalkaliphilus]